jgi:hypothetical protein
MRAVNFQVIKYKAFAALLIGAGFTSSLVLALNILPALASVVVLALLAPGSISASLLSRSTELGPPVAILAGNTVVYALAAYFIISRYLTTEDAIKARRIAAWLIVPVVTLCSLVSFPRFNPLWPRGMNDLTKQERDLQGAFQPGMELTQCRVALQTRGISVREEVEPTDGVVLDRGDRKIMNVAGDRILSARLQTGASSYPCGYDMEIVLVFGQDDKLKQQYIAPARICP